MMKRKSKLMIIKASPMIHLDGPNIGLILVLFCRLEIEAQGDVGIDLVGEVAPAEGGT